MEEKPHFPGQTDQEFEQQEQQPEETPKDAPTEEAPATGDTPEPGDEPKPEEKSEEPKPEDPPAPLTKPRSIYTELKDTRKELKEAKARIEELEGGEKPPTQPAEPFQPETPADDLETFAEQQGVTPEVITRLAEIIAKRIPAAQLSDEDKAGLERLRAWEATQAREQEDKDIDAQAPAVKTLAKELGFEIHNEAEVANIMAEVKRLAHTKEFADKPVDYIVFAKRAELSKMVSPKKKSFESGGPSIDAPPAADVDFASGKGITPEVVQRATTGTSTGGLEITKVRS